MSRRPRWILDFHPDFPAPEQIAPHLDDPICLPPARPGFEVWPEVEPPFVGYGTMRTMTRMLRHRPLAEAVFDDYPSLRCSSYYRAVYDLLGRNAVIVPLTALPHLDLHRFFGDRVFIRPDSNYKLFASGVVDVDRAAAFVADHEAHRDELVVVSEVVRLGPEYRCFCRAGEVFCHSSYPEAPYRPAPPEVIAFAHEAARRFAALSTARMVTVDVAVSEDRLRLVEMGGVNSWGIYGASIPDFIAGMEAEAMERWSETGHRG